MVTMSPQRMGFRPAVVPTDIATGIVAARNPVMFGIRSRTTEEAASSTPTTIQGDSATEWAAPTTPPASQSLAPERESAWASDSDAAMTKKFVQPTSCSNCRQVSTPRPGIRKHTQASRAGSVGCQWWTESVSQRSPAPAVISAVRNSTLESGRGSGRGGTCTSGRKPWR